MSHIAKDDLLTDLERLSEEVREFVAKTSKPEEKQSFRPSQVIRYRFNQGVIKGIGRLNAATPVRGNLWALL